MLPPWVAAVVVVAALRIRLDRPPSPLALGGSKDRLLTVTYKETVAANKQPAVQAQVRALMLVQLPALLRARVQAPAASALVVMRAPRTVLVLREDPTLQAAPVPQVVPTLRVAPVLQVVPMPLVVPPVLATRAVPMQLAALTLRAVPVLRVAPMPPVVSRVLAMRAALGRLEVSVVLVLPAMQVARVAPAMWGALALPIQPIPAL